MDRDRLAQEIAHVFAARNEDAAAVYLFGSVARGEDRPDSDVDVAVLYGKPVQAGLAGLKLALAGDLEARLGRRVDLVVLDSQPPDLVHRVRVSSEKDYSREEPISTQRKRRPGT